MDASLPCFSSVQKNLHFPRNSRPNFAQYISERPEVTPKGFGFMEGQHKKAKPMKNKQAEMPFKSSLGVARHLFALPILGSALLGLVLLTGNAWAAPSAIEGIVKDPKGQAISGADVRIEATGGSSWNKVVKTDAKGRYIHSDLETGTYRVTLLVDGSVKASINCVKTKAGDSTKLNFDLKTSTSARGSAAVQVKPKHMIYIPPQTGSHLGGWVAINDDGTVDTAGAERVEKKSAEALQKFQSRTGAVNLHQGGP
jgi:hypothetical protein